LHCFNPPTGEFYPAPGHVHPPHGGAAPAVRRSSKPHYQLPAFFVYTLKFEFDIMSERLNKPKETIKRITADPSTQEFR
jgi:hypothetical protein